MSENKVERMNYGVFVIRKVKNCDAMCIEYITDEVFGSYIFSDREQPVEMSKENAEQIALDLFRKGFAAFAFELPKYWGGGYPQLMKTYDMAPGRSR